MTQIQITYVQEDGSERTVLASEGMTLMQVALQHDVPNIVGMCGGTASCGTCHCHLPEEDYSALPPPSRMEAEMLECLDAYTPTSRLVCQVVVTPALSGLRLSVQANA